MIPTAQAKIFLVAVVTFSAFISNNSTYAGANSFFCGMSGSIPTTKARLSSGKNIDVIRWTSDTFEEAGWSAQRRCEQVSSRFEQLRLDGKLKYLTTGRINGQPVICSTSSKGGSCDGLLYTLKPNQDPVATLQNLLNVRSRASGPLNETTERIYIEIDEVLKTAEINNSVNHLTPKSINLSPNQLW